MNFLVLSCGTRNKVISYFKEALVDDSGKRIGKVVATDMSRMAPALYEADTYYIVPKITTEGYIDVILDICKKENIDAVFSLIDPELSLLAKNEKLFKSMGIIVIGSSSKICDMSLNKLSMYKWLIDHGYKTARSYDNKECFYNDIKSGAINYPVFVKPIYGSASIEISKVYDRETLECIFDGNKNLMIQEYMDGDEIGADVYIDMLSGEVVSIFTKKKLVMRAGETDKAISFKDEKLFDMIKDFVKEVGYLGQIDIDIFDINGEYYISEVNPRFGGGYPHAHESGCNHIDLIINNIKGISNRISIGKYKENTIMMKYNEVMML